MKITKIKAILLTVFILASQNIFSQMVVEVTPLQNTYNPSSPNYHHYVRERFLCKVESHTLDEVYSIFISQSKFLAPVYADQPVFDGCTLLLSISMPGIEFPGLHPIKVVFDKQLRKITNYTLPKHILHPGKVDRQIIQRNDSIFLKTDGVGAVSIDKFFVPYIGECELAWITANGLTAAERLKFGEPVSKFAAWLNERQCIVDDVWEPVDRILAEFLNKPDDLSDGARLLFSKDAVIYYTDLRLSSNEKEEIYKQLNLQISNDKKELHDKKDNKFEYALSHNVEIVDLNKDGKLEIFVSLYNLMWTGQGGNQIVFGKNNSGKFSEILNGQGGAAILTTTANGYPELLMGGPGMTAPTYRWNGAKYQFYKQVNFGAGSAPKMISFADFYKKQKAK